MVATALFYGIEQSTLAKDIAASFIASLMAMLPQLMIKIIFKKSKPKKKVKAKETGSPLAKTEEGDRTDFDMEKFQQFTVQREKLYKKLHPLPRWCRWVAWMVLLIVTGFAFVTAVCNDNGKCI